MNYRPKVAVVTVVAAVALVLFFFTAPVEQWLIISYPGETGAVYRSLGCTTLGIGTTYVAVNTDEFGFTPPGLHLGCNSPLQMPP